MRVFLDEGQAMARLLYQAAERDIAPEYTGLLLAQFPIKKQPISSPFEANAAAPPLIEPLTKRELEVVTLLANGCSNQEIAEQLVLSNNTVRAHLKNLYSKIGAQDRQHGVQRARELGLVE